MGIEADNELTGVERAHLAVLITDDGFKVLQKIMEDEVKRFNLALVNAEKPEDVIVKHNIAKAAASFYQGVINRIMHEVTVYRATPKVTDKPVDATDGMIDIGDIAPYLENVPNLMEIE